VYTQSKLYDGSEDIVIDVRIDLLKLPKSRWTLYTYYNDKWFINLSKCVIPPSTCYNLLQLGNQFCLPPDINKNGVIHEFIKHIECHNRLLLNIDKFRIRNLIISHLHKLLHHKNKQNALNNRLLSLYNETVRFYKNNSELIFTEADKGNVTVALDNRT